LIESERNSYRKDMKSMESNPVVFKKHLTFIYLLKIIAGYH